MVITEECGKAKAYEAMLRACREVDLVIKHLSEVNYEEDLLLFDRNDATYEFMATLLDQSVTQYWRVRNFSHLVVGRETLSCGNI